MSRIVTFAYGSNMLWERIRRRVPSACPLGRATLRGHELAWHKVGRDGSGKCDLRAVADDARVVQGVLYEFSAADKPLLDAAEGLGAGYEERQVSVVLGGGAATAMAYFATRIDPALRPFTWYRALVVAGAIEQGLPGAYIDSLRRVDAIDDSDADRAALNWAIANGA